MIEFNASGNLIPGIHTYTFDEVQTQLVNEFEVSKSRTPLFETLQQLIVEVREGFDISYMWIDGSFVTMKIDPNDIDLIFFLKDEVQMNSNQNILDQIRTYWRSKNMDVYFSSDPNFTLNYNSTTLRNYWRGQFGFDRNDEPKGIILIHNDEIQQVGR